MRHTDESIARADFRDPTAFSRFNNGSKSKPNFDAIATIFLRHEQRHIGTLDHRGIVAGFIRERGHTDTQRRRLLTIGGFVTRIGNKLASHFGKSFSGVHIDPGHQNAQSILAIATQNFLFLIDLGENVFDDCCKHFVGDFVTILLT